LHGTTRSLDLPDSVAGLMENEKAWRDRRERLEGKNSGGVRNGQMGKGRIGTDL